MARPRPLGVLALEEVGGDALLLVLARPPVLRCHGLLHDGHLRSRVAVQVTIMRRGFEGRPGSSLLGSGLVHVDKGKCQLIIIFA